MIFLRTIVTVAAALTVLVGAATTVAQDKGQNEGQNEGQKESQKIVSIDYCADQFLLALADRDQIAALSYEATAPHSFYKDRAQGIPQVYPNAEAVLHHAPRLVVKSWQGDARFHSVMDRLDVEVFLMGFGTTMETVYTNLRRLGKRLGQSAKAELLIDQMQSRHEKLQQAPALQRDAVYLTPGAFTTGTGTFMHQAMALAGLKNRYAAAGKQGWFALPLEDLVMDRPALLVTSFFDVESATQQYWGVGRHAFVQKLLRTVDRVDIPGRYTGCNGLFLLDAAEFIRAEMGEAS